MLVGCVGETHSSVRYLMREKSQDLQRVGKPLFGSKVKPLLPKLSVEFKCQIVWSEITNKFAKKKCLDASSL